MGDKDECDNSPGHTYAALIISTESNPLMHLGATGLCIPSECADERYFTNIEQQMEEMITSSLKIKDPAVWVDFPAL